MGGGREPMIIDVEKNDENIQDNSKQGKESR
jgi:hypothetical protein